MRAAVHDFAHGTLWRTAATLLAAAFLAACAALPTRSPVGPIAELAPDIAPPSASRLSDVYATAASRRDVAERVWKVVNERFYDPGFNQINWAEQAARYVPAAEAAASDAQLYAALKALAGSLRDSHTRVLTPREVLDRRGAPALRLGIELRLLDGRVVIVGVEPDSPAARAGVRSGDILLAAGAMSFDALFLAGSNAPVAEPAAAAPSAERARLASDADSDQAALAVVLRTLTRQRSEGVVELRLSRDDAAPPWTVRLQAAPLARRSEAHLRWLDGGIAVLRFNRFTGELMPKIDVALDQVAEARALIIDLRGNPGGQLAAYRWFVTQFLPTERVVMQTLRRADAAQAFGEIKAGQPRRAPLLLPLAILTDRRTASAAELTAVTLHEQRGALVVGEPTCGCVVGVRAEFVLPDGGGLHVAETGFVSAAGMRMEGQPTRPHVMIGTTLSQLRSATDAALQRAAQALSNQLLRQAQTEGRDAGQLFVTAGSDRR